MLIRIDSTLFLLNDFFPLLYSCDKHLLPGGSVVKNLPANAKDTRLVSGLGRSLGEGNGSPLQHSCLEIPLTKEPGGLQFMELQKGQVQLGD